MPTENFTRLERYVRDGYPHIEGWFFELDVELTAALLEHQLTNDSAGGVAEIGVHHGKSFVLLANGLREGEMGVALDVFEDQEKNLDHAGRGDRVILEENLAAWAPDANVRIVKSSSLEITAARETFGDVRYFSIDGGHTAQITENDLRLAQSCAVPGAVVMLDDILNAHWTGVITGFVNYSQRGGTLIPFAVSNNRIGASKLYLSTSAEGAASYRELFRSAKPDLVGKADVEFFSYQVDVMGKGSSRLLEEIANEKTHQRAQITELRKLTTSRATLHADLEESRKALVEAQAKLRSMGDEVDRLEKSKRATEGLNTALRRTVAELERKEASFDVENRALRRRIKTLKQGLADIQSSRSWRLMAPIRGIVGLVRRGQQK